MGDGVKVDVNVSPGVKEGVRVGISGEGVRVGSGVRLGTKMVAVGGSVGK